MVRVVTLSAGGRKATIRYARPGDCVGVLSLVTAWHPVAVEAVTDAQVLFVDVDILTDLARREPGVGWALAQYVAEVSTDVIEMMSSAVFGSVRQRLARHLLDLAVQRGGVLYVLQGQTEMADAVGSVREVVARTIREFREQGLVSRDGVGLRLDDPAGLDAVAASD